MRAGVLALSLLLAGCGAMEEREYRSDPRPVPDYTVEVDVLLLDEVAEFYAQFPDAPRRPVVLGDTGNDKWIGVCRHDGSVIIDPAWANMGIMTWTLVFHELGHCALYLPHVDTPGMIMYPIVQIVSVEDRPARVQEMREAIGN